MMNDEDKAHTMGRPPELPFKYDPNIQIIHLECNMDTIEYMENNFPEILKYPLHRSLKIRTVLSLEKDQ